MEIVGQFDVPTALTVAEDPHIAIGLGGRTRDGLHSVKKRKIPASDKSMARAARRIFTVSTELFWRCPHRIACLITSNQWVQFLSVRCRWYFPIYIPFAVKLCSTNIVSN